MSESILAQICSDGQIRKFCAYGFLKNLKFFEIPSGFIADYFGNRRSFVPVFFFTSSLSFAAFFWIPF